MGIGLRSGDPTLFCFNGGREIAPTEEGLGIKKSRDREIAPTEEGLGIKKSRDREIAPTEDRKSE